MRKLGNIYNYLFAGIENFFFIKWQRRFSQNMMPFNISYVVLKISKLLGAIFNKKYQLLNYTAYLKCKGIKVKNNLNIKNILNIRLNKKAIILNIRFN